MQEPNEIKFSIQMKGVYKILIKIWLPWQHSWLYAYKKQLIQMAVISCERKISNFNSKLDSGKHKLATNRLNHILLLWEYAEETKIL